MSRIAAAPGPFIIGTKPKNIFRNRIELIRKEPEFENRGPRNFKSWNEDQNGGKVKVHYLYDHQ